MAKEQRQRALLCSFRYLMVRLPLPLREISSISELMRTMFFLTCKSKSENCRTCLQDICPELAKGQALTVSAAWDDISCIYCIYDVFLRGSQRKHQVPLLGAQCSPVVCSFQLRGKAVPETRSTVDGCV